MKDKVVLLDVGNDYPRYEGVLHSFPPVSILAVGSYLAAHNVPVEVIDVQMDFGFALTSAGERVVCERVARYLQSQVDAIAWVGLSQLSNSASGGVMAQEIHRALPETPIIFGGYFPARNDELLLRKYPFITAVAHGDGEETALQISRALADGTSFLCDRIPNLTWQDAQGIHRSPFQPIALNNLPILDYRLLHNASCYQTVSTLISRGCPFHCDYCYEDSMHPYAAYPMEWLARQLDHLETELECRNIVFVDSLFGVGRERTLEICRVLKGRNFHYAAESRVDVMSPDLMPALRESGLDLVYWGVESASPSTLMRMNKVHSVAEAERFLQAALKVFEACFENSIIPFMGMMTGFPGDTEDDLRASLDFVKKVEELHDQVTARTGVETGYVAFTQPTQIYEGTRLAERLVNDPQVVLAESSFDGEKCVVSPSPGLDSDTVRAYEEEMNNCGRYPPRVQELSNLYVAFPAQEFVQAHPELTDADGVTRYSDKVIPLMSSAGSGNNPG